MIGYKATRPEATSFYDCQMTWAVGKTTSIPVAKRRDVLCGAGLLHLSDTPAETLLGGSWRCLLFRVEGTPVAQNGHKYGAHRLKVIEELPAWQALGPNGEEVAALIERAGRLTVDEVRRLAAAWGAARGAVRGAVCALVVRDLITPEHFDVLYGPWRQALDTERTS